MPESINNSAERNFPKEEKNPPLLPDFEGFTFTLSPEEEKQYARYANRESVKIIKYLEALSRAALVRAFEEVKEFAFKGVRGPTLNLLQRQLGGKERITSDWLAGKIAQIVQKRHLTDYREFDALFKKLS